LEWYRQVGFIVEQLWQDEGQVRGAVLVAGVGRLMLAQDDWAKGRDRMKGQGVRLYLTTTQDVDQVAANIKERGGELESEPADMPWGARALTLVDPDGFQLTIADG
jgi:uncharacterized glyoxalase superfamily protein PhnB